MMEDLSWLRHDHHGCRVCVIQRAEAADEIERLRAANEDLDRVADLRLNEIERLRAALQESVADRWTLEVTE